MPPIAVNHALGTHIPEHLPIFIPAISAVDLFIIAVSINIETSDLVVIGKGLGRIRCTIDLPSQRKDTVFGAIKCHIH